MNTSLLKQNLLRITKDILIKQLGCKDEQKVLVFDRQSPLSNLIADAYIANMPDAEHIDFDSIFPEVLREKLLSLHTGSTVILVQSRNFRLDNFRIRLQLFNNGVGCLEHTHLHYFYENEFETYLNALEYRSNYYKTLGKNLSDRLNKASSLRIVSHNGSILEFGAMEDAKINDGNFKDQIHRGGGAICGEVFSEAKDFSTVNGKLMISCYPGNDLRIIQCEPFCLEISKSMVTCRDQKCPKDFKENILERIAENEDNEVILRETGFGLNPAISFKNHLADVNAFERLAGFHVSLGKKHNIYRNKFHKSITQRYHIDVFADLKEIIIDNEVVFSEGKYLENVTKENNICHS